MSTAQYLTTNNYKLSNAMRFMDAIQNQDDVYYLFTGECVPFSDSLIPIPVDDVYTTVIDVWRTMNFGKVVGPNNVSLMIKNYPYTSGTVYVPYDDSNPLILEQQFYVVVQVSTNYYVYKCIDNNNGAPSTVQPAFSSVNAYNNSFMTADGYTWKYMFTIDQSTYNNFNTPTFIPYLANTSVQNLAINGIIDTINVASGGVGYSNYTNGTFSVTDISLGGNNLLYTINAAASPLNTYYNNCYIYITADPNGNSAGQYRQIVNYTVNSTCKLIQLNTAFNPLPQNGAIYTINPGVIIAGDGTETTEAAAQALINPATGNSVYYIDMLNTGANYKSISANVFASNVVGVTANASLRGIYSPPGGHGANVAAELGASTVGLYVSYANSEGNTIPTDCSYQRVGLLKNPSFSNVMITTTNSVGTFITSENVYKIEPVQVQATCSGNTTSPIITGNGSSFVSQLTIGSPVVLSNGSVNQLSNVVAIQNSTQMTISTNCSMVSNSISLYTTNLYATGNIVSSYSNTIIVNNLQNPINHGDTIIGQFSGCLATANVVTRAGTAKNYNTFIQAAKYQTLSSTGQFVDNEIIQQGNSYGTLMSIANNSGTLTLLVTNQFGYFTANSVVTGQTSGATALLTTYYGPELVFASGDVEYIENFNTVQRTNSQTETFKLMLQF
ncbi:MAG: hypothetical protein P4L79_09845 [Legionella sp.]|uniref:hypothetical protein n=1 Tax=Legionella sp. TaxID=459 RepID=UPI00283DE662|nr:hypothetical protein [Legionella sp.]